MADFNLLDFQRAYQNHGKGGLMNYGINQIKKNAVREELIPVQIIAGRRGTPISGISKEEEARRKAADEAEYQKKKDYEAKKGQKIEASVENPDDFIEFTYVPGDTFGQKILDLGIGTDNGLWGENGDVAYYTQQLIDGGYLDDNGNVKLGVPIRLKKRK